MANASYPSTNLLTDAGYLLWAPTGTALPANTVSGGVFTDAWTAPWVCLGMTTAGSKIDINLTVSEIEAAEQYDPLAYRTTKRTGQITFALMNFTAGNLVKALNGATSTVTGSAGTTLTQIDPPTPGAETPCMLGWESLNSDVRWIGRQVRNSGNISIELAKAPKTGTIPWTGVLEKPASAQPFSFYVAGTARA